MFRPNSVAPLDDDVFEAQSEGSLSSSQVLAVHVTKQQSGSANLAYNSHDDAVDTILNEEFGRRFSSFNPSSSSLLTVPGPAQRRHSVAVSPTPGYAASFFPNDFGQYGRYSSRSPSTYSIDRLTLPRDSLAPPMSPGGMSLRSNWSELIRLADRKDSIDSIGSFQSQTIVEPVQTIPGISPAISDKLLGLVARFSSRTERFKERAVQPPTPSTDSFDTKSVASTSRQPKQHRLASLIPIVSRLSGKESTMEPTFVNMKCCKIKLPRMVKYFNLTRTIDPTSTWYLMWLLLVTLAFMYNVTAVPLRAAFVRAEYYHKEVVHRTHCEHEYISLATEPNQATLLESSTSNAPTMITNGHNIAHIAVINNWNDNITEEITPVINVTCRNITTTKTKYYPGIETDENRKYWWFLDYVCDLIYVIDILFVKPRVHFVKNGLTERGRKECFKHYINSIKFRYDVLSLTPLDLFYLVPVFKFSTLLRLPRFLKIFTFWEFYDRMDQLVNNSHMIRVLRTLTYMLFLIHVESCGYYIASAYEGLNKNEWVYSGQGRAYIRCMYLATKTATSIGNNPKPQNQLEWSFMTLYWLSGVFVFAMLIGQIRDIFQAANASKTNYREIMDKTIVYMNSVNVPDKVQSKVRAWFNYNWEHQKTLNENLLLEALPRKMKADLAIHVHYEILSKVQLFQDCDKMLLFDLVLKLEPVLYLPQDYICLKGEVGTEMYIVMLGQVEVVGGANNDIVFATLHQGSVFGEISLLALAGGNRRTANVRSKGFSQLFILSKADFEEAMADYPEAQKILKKKAKKLLSKNTKTENTVRKDETIIKPRQDTPKMLTTVVKVIEPESKIHDYLGTRGCSRKVSHIASKENENTNKCENADEENDEQILVVEQIERPITDAELQAYAARDKTSTASEDNLQSNNKQDDEFCNSVSSLDRQILEILDSPDPKASEDLKRNLDEQINESPKANSPSEIRTAKVSCSTSFLRKIGSTSNKVAPQPSGNQSVELSLPSSHVKGRRRSQSQTFDTSPSKKHDGVKSDRIAISSPQKRNIVTPQDKRRIKSVDSDNETVIPPPSDRRDSVVITVQKCHVSADGTVTCVPEVELNVNDEQGIADFNKKHLKEDSRSPAKKGINNPTFIFGEEDKNDDI